MIDKIVMTCLSIDCPERKSLCCGAMSRVVNGEEGTSYFECSNCHKEYIGGKCINYKFLINGYDEEDVL